MTERCICGHPRYLHPGDDGCRRALSLLGDERCGCSYYEPTPATPTFLDRFPIRLHRTDQLPASPVPPTGDTAAPAAAAPAPAPHPAGAGNFSA